jgi:hypothetical protein
MKSRRVLQLLRYNSSTVQEARSKSEDGKEAFSARLAVSLWHDVEVSLKFPKQIIPFIDTAWYE